MNNNGKNLLDKMSDVDPKLIADAEKKPFKKRNLFVGLTSGMATVAAAAVIAVAAAHNPAQVQPVIDSTSEFSSSSITSSSGTSSTQEPPVVKDPPALDFSGYKDLPKVSTVFKGLTGEGGGNWWGFTYEEYDEFFKDACEAIKEAEKYGHGEFETLPVYMSHSNDPDIDKMKARLLEVTAALGYSESGLEITLPDMTHDEYRKLLENMGVPQEEIDAEIERVSKNTAHMAEVTAKADGVSFSIRTNFTVEIYYDEPIPLPEGCDLVYGASDEAVGKAVDHLYEKYKAIADYDDPVRVGNKIYSGESFPKKIYEFIEFSDGYGSEPGMYQCIRIHSADGCEYLGNYPLLTVEQAEAILKSNRYSDEDRMPENAEIVGKKIYYSDNYTGSTGLLPYYSFYVLTDKEPYIESVDVMVDIYSIPAVPEEFIEIDTDDYGIRA